MNQDTGVAIFGIYALGAAALVAAGFFAVPASSGLRFLEVWTAITLLFPLGIAWDRGGKPAAWVATLCGWALLAGHLRYHLFAISGLVLVSAGLLDSKGREPKAGENQRRGDIIGTFLLILICLIFSIVELRHIPAIERFRQLDAQEVSRIELVPLDENLKVRGEMLTVTDPAALRAVVGAFRSSYPYYANHETVAHYHPWRMKVRLRNAGPAEILTLGSRTSDNDDAVYVKFEDGRGQFQNRPLRDALMKFVPQLAESSW